MNLWGEFEEDGYRFQAYLPSSENDRNTFYVKVKKDDEVVREEHIPLTWTPTFGPDAADVVTLEHKVDEILKELRGEK